MKEKIIEYLPWIVIIILIFVIDNAYGKQHEYESKEDYNRGYEDGMNSGYHDAFDEGYNSGYSDGLEAGWDSIIEEYGHPEDIMQESYNEGYEDGYAYGYDDASNGRPYDGEY